MVFKTLYLVYVGISLGLYKSLYLQFRQRSDHIDQGGRLVNLEEQTSQLEHRLGEGVVVRDPLEQLLEKTVLRELQCVEVITVNHQVEGSQVSDGGVFYCHFGQRATHFERSLSIQSQEHSTTRASQVNVQI